MPPLLSVVIALFNTENEIQICLESIFKNEWTFFEVIIVDDCSTDNSLSVARQFPCRFLSTDKNSGPAKARNMGVREARAEIILFIDSDTRVKNDSLLLFYEAFQQHLGISAVIALPEYQSLRRGRAPDYNALRNHYTLASSADYTDYFTTQMGAIRKQSFLAVGGFNENFTSADIEDIELGMRLPHNSILIHKGIVIGHHFPPFDLILKKYIRRAALLTQMLNKNKRLCQTHASKSGMFSVWIALLSILLLLLSFCHGYFLLLFGIVIMFFILLNINLFLFSVKARGGMYFLEAVLFEYVFSLAIGLGGIASKLRITDSINMSAR